MRGKGAMQVWAREFNARKPVPMNIFMPGVVRTKILDDEPGRMQRMMVGVAKAVIGVSPEKSAQQVLSCIEQVTAEGLRDTYFSRARAKGHRSLEVSSADGQRVWDLVNSLLAKPERLGDVQSEWNRAPSSQRDLRDDVVSGRGTPERQ